MNASGNVTADQAFEPDRSFTAEQALILFCNLIVSFACGCATRKEDYIQAVKRPLAPAICCLAQFVLRPATAYGLCVALEVPNGAAIGVLLCCCAPGGNGSNLMELLFGGDIELGIVCTTLSSIVAAGGIPLSIFLFVRHLEDVDFEMPWEEMYYTLGCVLIGAIAGSLTRYKSDRIGARLEQACATIGVIILLGTVAFALVLKWEVLYQIGWRTWLVSLVLAPFGTLYGWAPAGAARFAARQARTIAIETGEVNIGVAYAIMLLVWPEGEKQDAVFTGIITYTIFNQVLVWLLTIYWARARVASAVSGFLSKRGAGGGGGFRSRTTVVAIDEEKTTATVATKIQDSGGCP